MTENCIFCKINHNQIPSKKILENKYCMSIHDIEPRAQIHFLVIPKKHISTLNDISTDDIEILGHVMHTAKESAQKLGLTDYRLLMNIGEKAGQAVFHIHIHVMSPE